MFATSLNETPTLIKKFKKFTNHVRMLSFDVVCLIAEMTSARSSYSDIAVWAFQWSQFNKTIFPIEIIKKMIEIPKALH